MMETAIAVIVIVLSILLSVGTFISTVIWFAEGPPDPFSKPWLAYIILVSVNGLLVTWLLLDGTYESDIISKKSIPVLSLSYEGTRSQFIPINGEFVNITPFSKKWYDDPQAFLIEREKTPYGLNVCSRFSVVINDEEILVVSEDDTFSGRDSK